MKSLIIGKNSRIIRSIEKQLADFDLVSHTELDQVDLKVYHKIYLFSWSHNSFSENLSVIKKLNLQKVCFISTIAVLSLLRRPQWASYPNHKAQIE